jgi:hypothetical protein
MAHVFWASPSPRARLQAFGFSGSPLPNDPLSQSATESPIRPINSNARLLLNDLTHSLHVIPPIFICSSLMLDVQSFM